jgi:hypothetical protein
MKTLFLSGLFVLLSSYAFAAKMNCTYGAGLNAAYKDPNFDMDYVISTWKEVNQIDSSDQFNPEKIELSLNTDGVLSGRIHSDHHYSFFNQYLYATLMIGKSTKYRFATQGSDHRILICTRTE